jgi:phenylalanyl-tRNA synthetase beta chain
VRPLVASLPAAAALHPGRAATLLAGDEVLAVVGEVAPATRRAYGLEGRQTHAEVVLEPLARLLLAAGSEYRPIPRFPVAPFDVAVVVPRRTPASAVRAVIEEAVAGHGQNVRVFDVYEGPAVPEGQRSLAFALELFDREATLTSAQAEALRRKVQQALELAGWAVRTAAKA